MTYSNCAAQLQNMWTVIKTSIHFKTINVPKNKGNLQLQAPLRVHIYVIDDPN